MDMSIIFGTYNRLASLHEAVHSIRKSAEGLKYEIVVCDGGSTDGSREWLASQDDVVLVAKRSLDGAVDAFNCAYAHVRGRYVANFNDDAVYEGDALKAAFGFLEQPDNEGVGQIAFELNVGDLWRHQTCVGSYVYANFGVARREIADAVAEIQGGFWAPCYRTYGGDCEFSLWVWRLGWRVQGLPARVRDLPVTDDLRRKNSGDLGEADSALFRKRWPTPSSVDHRGSDPQVGEDTLRRYYVVSLKCAGANAVPRWTEMSSPWATLHELDPAPGMLPQRATVLEPERVLHVKMETQDDPQTDQELALRGFGEYLKFDLFDQQRRLGVTDMRTELLRTAANYKPTLIFAQLQSPDVLDVDTIRRIRGMVRNHRLIVVTWCGDVSRPNSIHPSDVVWQKELYQHADLALYTSLDQVQSLRDAGVPQAAYLQIGYDTGRYHALGEQPRRWEIAFIANVHGFVDCGTPERGFEVRIAAARALREAQMPIKCYGGGWAGTELGGSPLPQSESGDVYRRAAMALNVSNANTLGRYSSDRLFRALACGGAVLTKRFPGTLGLGLRNRENCLIWENHEELLDQVFSLDTDQAAEIGRQGAELAKNHHTWFVRAKELQLLIRAARRAKRVS